VVIDVPLISGLLALLTENARTMKLHTPSAKTVDQKELVTTAIGCGKLRIPASVWNDSGDNTIRRVWMGHLFEPSKCHYIPETPQVTLRVGETHDLGH
jgi:hypothetical protein